MHYFILNAFHESENLNAILIKCHSTLLLFFKCVYQVRPLKATELFSVCTRKIDNNCAAQPGCKGQPLFNIPLENVLIDELHLLLRITDRLEHGIIFDVIGWDQVFMQVYALDWTKCSNQEINVTVRQIKLITK